MTDQPARSSVLDDPYLNATDLAERLGFTPKTITERARAGQIPGAVRLGRRWRFHKPTVETFLADQMSREPVAIHRAEIKTWQRSTPGRVHPSINVDFRRRLESFV